MKAEQNITEHTDHPLGSIGHYKHYLNEYRRVEELAKNAKGSEAVVLYYELDGIVMILEEYES